MVDLKKLARTVFGKEVEVDLPAKRMAYLRAFNNPEGKRHILPDILEFTGFLRSAPMHGDPFMQGRIQGRRDVGLHILEQLNLDPVELYAILKGQVRLKQEDFSNG